MGTIATNDITGDKLKSKESTDKFRDNWDRIFKGDTEEVPLGEDTRPKDRVKLGVSPSCNVTWMDCREESEDDNI